MYDCIMEMCELNIDKGHQFQWMSDILINFYIFQCIWGCWFPHPTLTQQSLGMGKYGELSLSFSRLSKQLPQGGRYIIFLQFTFKVWYVNKFTS